MKARVEIERSGSWPCAWNARVTAKQWEREMWCPTERSARRWAARSAKRAERRSRDRDAAYSYTLESKEMT